MLNLLTRSSIRRKIILLFIYNQRKEFYLSEVARQVKTTPGTAQRELNRLLAMDLLVFQKRGNLNFYKVNVHYSLLKEIEAIVRKAMGVETELGKALSRIKGISVAFLFGSYAKGNMKSDSDLDLFIIGSPGEDDVYRAVHGIEGTVGRTINYHIMGKAEFTEKSRTSSFIRDIVDKPLMILGNKDELKQLLG